MNLHTIIPNEAIMNKIHLFRTKKVMIDADLASLYQVETKYLKRQVKRNPPFPHQKSDDRCGSCLSLPG
jgi:hypothetical protein